MSIATNPTRTLGTVRVFACGGCAINIVSKGIEYLADQDNDGYATVNTTYVDASNSNLDAEIDSSKIYLIEGLDGSGQKRSQNAEHVVPRIKDILQNFKPASLNIILHSLSGGSGSIIGPLITKELLMKDLPVVVIGVGDSSTRMYTNNTLNTIKTYEAISKQVNAPVNMIYRYNEGSSSRSEVDKFVINIINDLTALFSNQHLGMDSQDLLHFLRYEKVTDIEPQLSCFSVTVGDERLPTVAGNPISVATLATKDQDSDYYTAVEYHTEGVISPELDKLLYGKATHFVISDGYFDHVVKSLNETLKNIDQEKESRVKRNSILTSNDNVNDSGLVL